MKETQSKIKDVDQYIALFPESTKELLEQIRSVIRDIAPLATESISYGMPAYKMNGPLVYFAGYKNHIGFYPTASGIEHFANEISVFKSSKGAVQFPIDIPLPLELVRRIVKFRLEENDARHRMSKVK